MVRENLRNRRIALGFTQSHVAKAAEIDRTYYSVIENGKKNGSIDVWLRILKVLNIPETQLGEYLETSEKKGA